MNFNWWELKRVFLSVGATLIQKLISKARIWWFQNKCVIVLVCQFTYDEIAHSKKFPERFAFKLIRLCEMICCWFKLHFNFIHLNLANFIKRHLNYALSSLSFFFSSTNGIRLTRLKMCCYWIYNLDGSSSFAFHRRRSVAWLVDGRWIFYETRKIAWHTPLILWRNTEIFMRVRELISRYQRFTHVSL